MSEFKYGVNNHKNDVYGLSVSIDLGMMTPDDLITLGNLGKKYNVSACMSTVAKKIMFMDVAKDDVNPFWEDLEEAFGARLSFPHGKIIPCVGGQHCKFGQIDSFALGKKVEEISKKYACGKVKVGIAGCPVSCSMIKIRDIGIVATAKGFTLSVGGNGGNNTKVADIIATELSEERLLEVVEKIYQYIAENKQGKERSDKTIARQTLDDLKSKVFA